MIDICDFAVGLSRQLYGLTIATERADHRMMETWHPLGVCGVISAFNFPVAVWSWNAALAFVCGDPVVWKPSEKTPLTALADAGARAPGRWTRFGGAPEGLCEVLIGGREVGEALVDDHSRAGRLRDRLDRHGPAGRPAARRPLRPRHPRARRQQRRDRRARRPTSTWRCAPSPSRPWARPASAARRCAACSCTRASTTARRRRLQARLRRRRDRRPARRRHAGRPADRPRRLRGHGAGARRGARRRRHGPWRRPRRRRPRRAEAFYVRPALVEMPAQIGPMLRETFAPILYVMRYRDLDEAIAPAQRASAPACRPRSSPSTCARPRRFLSAAGSDCGIANVNIGPSGAEIGGAFGGEKETGGGREAGSDAWKAYMRRATNTINYGTALPLAQGVKFDIDAVKSSPTQRSGDRDPRNVCHGSQPRSLAGDDDGDEHDRRRRSQSRRTRPLPRASAGTTRSCSTSSSPTTSA